MAPEPGVRRSEMAQWPSMFTPEADWPKARQVGNLSWQDDAACRDADDVTSERLIQATRQVEVADIVTSLCRPCPVAAACLRAGRSARADGVYGGVVLVDGAVRRRSA